MNAAAGNFDIAVAREIAFWLSGYMLAAFGLLGLAGAPYGQLRLALILVTGTGAQVWAAAFIILGAML